MSQFSAAKVHTSADNLEAYQLVDDDLGRLVQWTLGSQQDGPRDMLDITLDIFALKSSCAGAVGSALRVHACLWSKRGHCLTLRALSECVCMGLSARIKPFISFIATVVGQNEWMD